MQILMTTDDANEINPYLTSSPYNSPFTDAQIEQMLRFPDIDGTTLDDRVVRLLNFNVGAEKSRSWERPTSSTRSWPCRERMRRMWTAQSWDLIHFSNPPVFGDPANIPGPGAVYAGGDAASQPKPPMPNDAAVYASAADAEPAYGVFDDRQSDRIQHNG